MSGDETSLPDLKSLGDLGFRLHHLFYTKLGKVPSFRAQLVYVQNCFHEINFSHDQFPV